MWAGLTPDSKGDPTGDTEEPDRRRQETPHLSARRKGALPASPGGNEGTCETVCALLALLSLVQTWSFSTQGPLTYDVDPPPMLLMLAFFTQANEPAPRARSLLNNQRQR